MFTAHIIIAYLIYFAVFILIRSLYYCTKKDYWDVAAGLLGYWFIAYALGPALMNSPKPIVVFTILILVVVALLIIPMSIAYIYRMSKLAK